MWKIIWASYLSLYFYTIVTQDYTLNYRNSMDLLFFGGILAFLVCFNYGISLREWIGQIKQDKKQDKELLYSLQGEVRELRNELIEMKLRLGWIRPHPDDEHTYIENNDLSNG